MPRRPKNNTTNPLRPDPNSVIKILISTDNHLGYFEKDPVRGDDSFRAFEEVLAIAKTNNVDMLLLGGDLFHDNKPSRSTIVKTMKLLRKYCMSPDGSVRLAVRSDPSDINYMNPTIAVSLPVFIIHGNHDDPTGGAGVDALSAIDLLAQAGLVSYFGKMITAKKIDVIPILLQKGNSALALYGLGNIRDEVLYDTWARQKNVRWLCPEQPKQRKKRAEQNSSFDEEEEEEDEEDELESTEQSNDIPWFNLFVLHQNRLTRGSSKGISETLLPPWLDYVVWGHEHDSLPDLTLSEPPVVQPGSTVATSLSGGEAKQKHAVLLEIYEGKLKHRPVPLYTVRNFLFDDVALSDQPELSETDPEGVKKFLDETITQMVEQQEQEFDKKLSAFQSGASRESVNGVVYPPRSFYIDKLTRLVRQPLVRLRVEVTGNWDPPNPQRFGQDFVGRAACPSDILLFYRSRRRAFERNRPFLQGHSAERSLDTGEDDDLPAHSQDAGGNQSVVQIPRLVQYYLYHRHVGGAGLNFLELDKLSSAVDVFVNKLENEAIPDYVKAYLKVQQDKTLQDFQKDGKPFTEENFLEKCKSEAAAAANRVLAEAKAKKAAEQEKRVREEIGIETDKAKEGQAAAEGEKNDEQMEIDRSSSPKDGGLNLEEQLDDVHAIVSANPIIVAATARTRALVSDDEEEEAEEGLPLETKRKATRGRGRGKGRGRGRVTTASRRISSNVGFSKPPTQSRPKRSARRSSTIEIADSDEEEVAAETPRDEIGIEDSEEEYVPIPTTRRRRARGSAVGSASRSASRARTDSASGLSQRRSMFAHRARMRRNSATVELEEDSGEDAM